MSFNLSLQVSKNVSVAPCVDGTNIITVCHLSDVCSTRQLIVSEVGSEALTMGHALESWTHVGGGIRHFFWA